MPNPQTDLSIGRQQAENLLLGYLQRLESGGWPGTDGMPTSDVLSSYPEFLARGRVPPLDDLVKNHADLGAELVQLFAELGLASRH